MPGAGARHREDLALKILALALSQSLLRQIFLWAHEGCTLGRHRLSYLNSVRIGLSPGHRVNLQDLRAAERTLLWVQYGVSIGELRRFLRAQGCTFEEG